MTVKRTVRLAAVGDIHCTSTSQGTLRPLFLQMSDCADVLLLCGDLTDYGLPDEARVLAEELAAVKTPVVAVLGNHDFESDQADEVRRILIEAGINVLDGESCEIQGIGFAGVKGFAGGFGCGTLSAWGETAIKHFVQEAVNEVFKLESALARLTTPQRVAVLHYAPIKATLEGEPPEILPFLGTSRLEEPLNRHHVSVVFHGHAHAGHPQGQTSQGIPVYNVAMPLLQRVLPDRSAFRVVEIEAEATGP